MAKNIYEAVRNNDHVLIGKNKYKVVYEDRNYVYFKKSPDATLEHINRNMVHDNFNSTGTYFWENFYISENKELRENRVGRESIQHKLNEIKNRQKTIQREEAEIIRLQSKIKEIKNQIHPSVMIIGGNGLEKAFNDLRIHANCLYRSKKHPDYEVWELLPEDFETLDFIKGEDWHKDWGWWRTGHCTLEGATDQIIFINGKEMYAYAPRIDGKKLNDYYVDLFSYLSDTFCAIAPHNRTYFATSLAKDNNMTLDTFMRTYQP